MGPEALGLWYELYAQTASRNGLHVNDVRYFESVFASRMQCPDPQVRVKLLTAFHEEQPLAADVPHTLGTSCQLSLRRERH